MQQVCLLTDLSAYFLEDDFPGSEFVYVLTPHAAEKYSPLKEISQPASGSISPLFDYSAEDFRKVILSLSRTHNEIIVILSSAQLNTKLHENAQRTAETLQGKVSLMIVDSQTIFAGLGEIVREAARAAQNLSTSSEIYRQVQKTISHIYTVFCTKDLSTLARQGEFASEHAFIGEMLGIAPILIIENGQIVATQKARNSRHLVELFLEYIEEFYKLNQIYLFQDSPVFSTEMHQLQDRLNTQFPEINARLLPTNPALRTIIGKRCIGMIVIDQ
jgi:DegV family protein with EDD domain